MPGWDGRRIIGRDRSSMNEKTTTGGIEKRRVTVTQLLKSLLVNPAGDEVGRVADFIAKLTDGGYPP